MSSAHAPSCGIPARSARAAFTASWPGVAAWGAGLVLCALGAGAIVGPPANALTRAAGVASCLLGALAFAWATVALARARLVAAHAVAPGALAGVLAATGVLVSAPAHTSVLAVAVAVVLCTVPAIAAAHAVRTGSARRTRPASVAGLIVAASALAIAVTPAAGSVQDAVLMSDDGTVPVVTHDAH